MIRVHTYCSYKLSPSGFQYGTFDITNDIDEDMYYLSDENKESIVSSAFDYGIIKRLKGKIPSKNTFIFLFKKIPYTYDSEHDDVGGDVAINMAFEFDSYQQFVSFSNGFKSYEKNAPLELARLLADCIVPDIKIKKYKLKIRKKNFDDFMKLIMENQQNIGTDELRLQRRLGIITDSYEKNLYCNDLQEIFNFDTINENGDEVGIMHSGGTMYLYPAKKKEKNSQIQSFPQRVKPSPLLQILAIALIVGLIVMMIVIPNNSHSKAVENHWLIQKNREKDLRIERGTKAVFLSRYMQM